MPDLELFLEKQKNNNVAFVIFLDYSIKSLPAPTEIRHPSQDDAEDDVFARKGSRPSADHSPNNWHVVPDTASVLLLCEVLKSSWATIMDEDEIISKCCDHDCDKNTPEDCDGRHENHSITNLDAIFFHYQPRIEEHLQYMNEQQQRQLNILLDYVNKEFREQYMAANSLFAHGFVTGNTIRYLFRPGCVIVQSKDGLYSGTKQESFVHFDADKQRRDIEAVSWNFDGNFRSSKVNLEIPLSALGRFPVKIHSLKFYPLSCADNAIEELLRQRGRKYWHFRKTAYVAYRGLSMTRDTLYVSSPASK